MKYSKEQKKEYFNDLRSQCKQTKINADRDTQALKTYQESGLKFSYYSFYFTLIQMKKCGFAGLPYISCKTFKSWQSLGFQVQKGQKAKIKGIAWITSNDDNNNPDKEKKFLYPKIYSLFHETQVKAI